MTTASYKALGTTTDHLTCECCGKINLRKTVVLQFFNEHGEEEGAPVHFGTTCAAKACRARGINATAQQITAAAAKADADARYAAQEIERINALTFENAKRNAERFSKGDAFVIFRVACNKPGCPTHVFNWSRAMDSGLDGLDVVYRS